MTGLWSVVTLVAGVALVATGLLLLSRAIGQLARAGAFSSLYWASFRRYAVYRVRSLRPALGGVLGLLLLGAGLTALYAGLVSFYGGRLLSPG